LTDRLGEKTTDGMVLRGVLLTGDSGEAVAREDWTLSVENDALVWAVARSWLRDMTVTGTGTPALFFSCRPENTSAMLGMAKHHMHRQCSLLSPVLAGDHNALYYGLQQ
jgi:hypothetical protein